MQYRIRQLDQETRERLQVEEGYGPDVCAVDRLPPNEPEWEFFGFSNHPSDAQAFINQSNNPDAHMRFLSTRPTRHFGDNMLAAAAKIAEHAAEVTPQEVRQQQRRSKAFEQLFVTFNARRPEAGTSVDILDVTWEEFQAMHAEYQDAVKQGLAKQCEFQPLAAYHNKIVQTRDDGSVKRILRHPFAGEVGILQLSTGQKIIRLKDQGPGDLGEKYFQVPKDGGSV